MRFISHTVVGIVLMVCVEIRTRRDGEYQNMIFLSVLIDTSDFFCRYRNGRYTKIKGDAINFINPFCEIINPGYCSVIFNSDY